nr:immunoglobulin light chain junction region [Macaca mulatta]MOX51015.1 immunoglobulin light chain junction region [Macaca mulatta]MOX51208.1 immunoglobulin light chain junction region [Macaca mulatta]
CLQYTNSPTYSF